MRGSSKAYVDTLRARREDHKSDVVALARYLLEDHRESLPSHTAKELERYLEAIDRLTDAIKEEVDREYARQ